MNTKISILQFAPSIGNLNKTINDLDRIINSTKLKTDILILPELANSGYNFDSKSHAIENSESLKNSIFIKFLIEKANQINGIIISGFNEKEEDKLYNSSIILDKKGIIGNYRKTHLFLNEKDIFSKGNLGYPIFKTIYGNIGMLICYDWNFPEAWRTLALKGAQLICHPSNLVLHYAQKVIPSHSICNRIYIATANRIGTEKNLTFTGNSILTNPLGEILSQTSNNFEGIISQEIDLNIALNKNITIKNNSFLDRRTDIYFT